MRSSRRKKGERERERERERGEKETPVDPDRAGSKLMKVVCDDVQNAYNHYQEGRKKRQRNRDREGERERERERERDPVPRTNFTGQYLLKRGCSHRASPRNLQTVGM